MLSLTKCDALAAAWSARGRQSNWRWHVTELLRRGFLVSWIRVDRYTYFGIRYYMCISLKNMCFLYRRVAPLKPLKMKSSMSM